MNKKEILETLREVLNDMSYYPEEGDDFYNSFNRAIEEKLRQFCKHEWKDITNEVIQNGEMCFKCGSIRA